MPTGIYKRKPISEETRKKLSESHKGYIMPEETKQKMRENAKINPNFGMKGKKATEETRRKSSLSHMGYKMPEEQKRKISESNKGKVGHESWNKGKKGIYSKEALNKMSIAQMGNKKRLGHHHTEETRQKIREKTKLQFKNGMPEETKNKLSEINKGKTYEERYGKEKAIKIRNKQSINSSGELHPNWLGGLSFEPYTKEFNKRFKELIRIRDGFLCLKCGMREEDSIILLKRRLSIHHIDYNKKNTIKENCCALCNRCNIEVNINRKSWTKFFQSLLSERYEYKYGENKNNIINLLDCEFLRIRVEDDIKEEEVDNILLNNYNNQREVK